MNLNNQKEKEVVPRLLLMEPFGRLKHVNKIRLLFLSHGWQVHKVSPDEKTYATNGVLLLPDTKGINANVSYFRTGGTACVPHIRPQDQAMEHHRLNSLAYYMQKGIGVMGLGTSAFLIFAEALQGNLSYGSEGLWFGASRLKLLDPPDNQTGKFFHDKPRVGGIVEYNINEELVIFAEQFLPRKNGGMEMAKVMASTTPPSNGATNKNENNRTTHR